METAPPHLGRIRECFPDLAISHVEVNTEGLVNDIVVINHDRVFRFPKTEWAKKALVEEARVLNLVRRYVDIQIPLFDRREDDFVTYRLIPGVPFLRDEVLRQDDDAQDRLAEQLATFLRQLHSIPMHELEEHGILPSDAARGHEKWVQLYEDTRRELFPLMMAHARDVVTRHFESVLRDPAWMDHQPALIDGDLGTYHVLWDRTARRITGVIDLGTAGMGDPAADFACIIDHFGETFLRRMARFYPEIGDAIERARFWAGTLWLQWALAGLRSRDLSWFMVHIGSARDAMPVGSGWDESN